MSALARRAGSSSAFSGLPVPTEVTCVPARTHAALMSGVVLAVAVTTTRCRRTAGSSAGATRVGTSEETSRASASARSAVRFHTVSCCSGSSATMARAVMRASAPAPTSSASLASRGAR